MLANGDLVSGSTDQIKIWASNDFALKKTIDGHKGLVCAVVQLQNGDLASGSSDYTIKIWNIKNILIY